MQFNFRIHKKPRTDFLLLVIACLHMLICQNSYCVTVRGSYARQTDDVAWIDATNNHVVYCWGDGTVRSLDTKQWKERYLFRLNEYKIYQSGLFLCLKADKPLFACMSGNLKLSIYNYQTGETLWNWNNPDAHQSYRGIGFSNDGKLYYLIREGQGIFFFDAESGFPTNYFMHSSACSYHGITSAENYIIIQEGGKFKGLSTEDKIVWEEEQLLLQSYSRTFSYPYFLDLFNPLLKPLGTSDVFLLSQGTGEKGLAALCLLDGSILWKENLPAEYLLAVTPDRQTQAYWKDGSVYISHWPNAGAVKVQPFDIKPLDGETVNHSNREVYNRTSDAAFTPDGKYLLTLPTLDIDHIDRETSIRHLSRKSNTLFVIDVSTGIAIQEIHLKKLQSDI